MTQQVIASVVPSSTAAGSQSRLSGRPGAVSPLPVVVPPTPPVAPVGVVYGMGRIDASGRVADRTVIRALNWLPGDRLTLTATPGVVIARRDPAGMVTLTTRPYVVIPAVLRRRCGLRAGDRVLLAATPREDVLAVYPLSVVDHAIRAQHDLLEVGGGQL